MSRLEEQDKIPFQNLYRVMVRLFYDDEEEHLAIPIVDYMVLNCKCSISYEELENAFKVKINRIRGALNPMKDDEMIREDEKNMRWDLNTNIKEIMQKRVNYLRQIITEESLKPIVKLLECPNCKTQATMQETDYGNCRKCKIPMKKQSSEENPWIRKKQKLDEVQKYLNACENRRIPVNILFPAEYLRHREEQEKKKKSIVVAKMDEGLHKRVLYKINERRRKENKPEYKFEEQKLEQSTHLREWFEKHPTKMERKCITISDVVQKRKLVDSIGNNKYEGPAGQLIKKLSR